MRKGWSQMRIIDNQNRQLWYFSAIWEFCWPNYQINLLRWTYSRLDLWNTSRLGPVCLRVLERFSWYGNNEPQICNWVHIYRAQSAWISGLNIAIMDDVDNLNPNLLGPAFQFVVTAKNFHRTTPAAGGHYAGMSVSAASLAAANKSLSILKPKQSNVKLQRPVCAPLPSHITHLCLPSAMPQTPPPSHKKLQLFGLRPGFVCYRDRHIALTTTVPPSIRINKHKGLLWSQRSFTHSAISSFYPAILKSGSGSASCAPLRTNCVLKTMGSSRQTLDLSSSPPKPSSSLRQASSKKVCLDSHLRPVLTLQHAQRLRIRLRLAYYKVLTNQANLPLKRLPQPQLVPDPAAAELPFSSTSQPFMYNSPAPSMLYQSTSHVFSRPHNSAHKNLSTPMLNSHKNLPQYTMHYTPFPSFSTNSVKNSASFSYSFSESTSLFTPAKQQHYPFHLGGYDMDDCSYTSMMSPDIYTSTKRCLSGTSANKRTKIPFEADKNRLQTGSLS